MQGLLSAFSDFLRLIIGDLDIFDDKRDTDNRHCTYKHGKIWFGVSGVWFAGFIGRRGLAHGSGGRFELPRRQVRIMS